MQKLGMNEDEYAEYQYNKLRNKADNYKQKGLETALFYFVQNQTYSN